MKYISVLIGDRDRRLPDRISIELVPATTEALGIDVKIMAPFCSDIASGMVSLAQAIEPDLIFLDVTLDDDKQGKGSGLVLARLLESYDLKSKVIIMSDNEVDREEALESADFFLVKNPNRAEGIFSREELKIILLSLAPEKSGVLAMG